MKQTKDKSESVSRLAVAEENSFPFSFIKLDTETKVNYISSLPKEKRPQALRNWLNPIRENEKIRKFAVSFLSSNEDPAALTDQSAPEIAHAPSDRAEPVIEFLSQLYPDFKNEYQILIENNFMKIVSAEKLQWLASTVCLAEYFGHQKKRNNWKEIAKRFIDRNGTSTVDTVLKSSLKNPGNSNETGESADYSRLKKLLPRTKNLPESKFID